MLVPPCLFRPIRLFAAACAAALAGCTAPGLLLTAAGVASDTSITWDIVKHVHGKITEGDPQPCISLNSVERALNARCDFVEGSIRKADLTTTGLQECPLAAAVRDARLWRALPELMAAGAKAEQCAGSPLQQLAEADACPDFAAAPPAVLRSLTVLAESDPRAVRHDVFRMLGCPAARQAGLDRILLTWLDRGSLAPGTLSFSPLGAADPDLLVSRFGRELEVAGHLPETALDSYDGMLAPGFEEALRSGHWAALEWWLYRLPQLANQVPPARGGQLAWLPLQRVLLPGFLQHAESQADMVGFLLAHGADPRKRLPFDSGKSVITFARAMKSPMLAQLDPPAAPAAPAPTVLARSSASDRQTRPAGTGATPARGPAAVLPHPQVARLSASGAPADTAAR